MTIKFNGYDLQSANILTEKITYRTFPDRNVPISQISRRAGGKILSDKFGVKTIEIKGKIIEDTADDLKNTIDDMHQYLSEPEKQLDVDDRAYVATCKSLEIPDRSFTQSMVDFKAVFICADPFAYSFSRTLPVMLSAGETSTTFSTTISGSAFSEPQVSVTFSGDAGDSGITSVVLDHLTSGEQVTVSGNFDRGLTLSFNYENATVTYSGLLYDYTGSFSQYDPGTNQLKIDLGGTNTYGITGEFIYRPRYYA